MFKKDFELIAEILRDDAARPRLAVYGTLAERFADSLANTNPRFNRAQFLAACCPK